MAPEPKPKVKPKVPTGNSSMTTIKAPSFATTAKKPTTTPSTPSTPTSQAQAASLLTAARKRKTTNSTPDFTESELLAFEICNDKSSLVAAMNDLLRSQDFALLQSSSPVADVPSSKPITYRLRAEQSVKTLRNLSQDAKQLYAMIEGANSNGIWSKTLSIRSKLHQVMCTKALKALEAAKLVKQMRSVKFPQRRLYLLDHLKPPSEATGGAWFTDGELDTEMVEQATLVAMLYIEGQSWRTGTKPRAGILEEAAAVEKLQKEKQKDKEKIFPHVNGKYWAESAWAPQVRKRRLMLPHEKGYTDYPTASDVLSFMERAGLVVGKDVNVSDVQVLLDMLVYDGRLEKMGVKKEEPDGVEDDLESEDEVDQKADDQPEESGSDVENAASKKRKRAPQSDHEDEEDIGDPPDEDDDPSASEADVVESTEEPKRKRRKQSRARSTSAKLTAQKHDNHLVPMYRSVRQPLGYNIEIGPGSALAETPCGRCPSFALCDDKGPISARSCEYLPGWVANAVM